MVTEARNASEAIRRAFYPLVLVDFGLAVYFAMQSRWVWSEAVTKSSTHRLDSDTLLWALFALFLVGTFVGTPFLIVRKRWFAAAIAQAFLTIWFIVNTGLILLWLLVSGPGKQYDPQNGMGEIFALFFATLVSLMDTRHLFGNARTSRYGAA